MAERRPGGSEPVYLTLEDVLSLHGLIIGASSTQVADQLRNRGGLESALARPAAYAHYEDADLAHQAAALAHAIAEGQQFIDGNKRTALVAMLTFLEINGLRARHRTKSWQIGYSASARAPSRNRLRLSYAPGRIASDSRIVSTDLDGVYDRVSFPSPRFGCLLASVTYGSPSAGRAWSARLPARSSHRTAPARRASSRRSPCRHRDLARAR